MKRKKIGIIDSGIGGKGIEKEIKKILPNVEIDYLADTKNFPYGTKKVSELHEILEKNIEMMLDKGAKVIVLACNSATVVSVKFLRKKFPKTPIVGVEPAIKPAGEFSKTRNIAIFATPITSKSKAQEDLIKKYCKDCTVYKVPFRNLARQIEENSIASAKNNIKRMWSKYRDKNIDAIVLGCTHYTLIRPEIQKIIGPKIKIIDSNKAVANQVKKIYEGLI